jgi:hypothetical protein
LAQKKPPIKGEISSGFIKLNNLKLYTIDFLHGFSPKHHPGGVNRLKNRRLTVLAYE